LPLIQLTYASRSFGYDASIIAGILLDARRCNSRDGITGTLICRQDLYLQLLEGPEDKVDAAYRRIQRDDRHLEVRRLTRKAITTRLFPAWAMRHDPVQSWMWTQAEVEAGAPDEATPADIIAIFERLAKEPQPA